jgi:hypothetical protein
MPRAVSTPSVSKERTIQERRRSPRVPIEGRLPCLTMPFAAEVILRDLSLGGFLLESSEPFPSDALHQFLVGDATHGQTVVLMAMSVHCRRLDDAIPPRYLTGFSFLVPAGQQACDLIRSLADQPTTVRSF